MEPSPEVAELRKKFSGEPEFIENFFRFLAEDVRELMAELGFRTIDEMVGRVDRLDMKPALDHWKAAGIDLSNVLHQPAVAAGAARHQTHPPPAPCAAIAPRRPRAARR